MKHLLCIAVLLVGSGSAHAGTREQVVAAGKQFEAALAECYDRVDFEAADAKGQAALCDYDPPSAMAEDSTTGDAFDTQIMSVGRPVDGGSGGKWALALSCHENKHTILAFMADAADTTVLGSKVTYRLGDDPAVTGDWEVLDRTAFIADDEAIALAKQIRERPSDELMVTTIANDVPSETRYSLQKLSGLSISRRRHAPGPNDASGLRPQTSPSFVCGPERVIATTTPN